MEAFAARFCACNHDAYPCAEAATFRLCHRHAQHGRAQPAHGRRAEDESRGFHSHGHRRGGDDQIGPESVAAIYDRVVTNEIKMHAAASRRAPSSSAAMKTKTSRAERSLAQALNFAAPWRQPIDAERGERRDGGTAQENQGVVSERRGYRTLREGDDEEARARLRARVRTRIGSTDARCRGKVYADRVIERIRDRAGRRARGDASRAAAAPCSR